MQINFPSCFPFCGVTSTSHHLPEEIVEDRIAGKDDAPKDEKAIKCNGNINSWCEGQNCEVKCGDGTKVSIRHY